MHALGGLSGTDLDALANSIATSIDPQAVGWWILTALAALVGVIVLAQALARQTALEADDYPVLGALGATRRQLFTLTMARTLAVALVGAAAGVLLATLLSFFVPVGEAARRPDTGVRLRRSALDRWCGGGGRGGPRSGRLVRRQRLSAGLAPGDDPVVQSSRVVAL